MIAHAPTPLNDDDAMELALSEARAAAAQGEVPVGAITIVGGLVVASRHNERERTSDPTAHAEMLALRDTAAALGSWRLPDVTLVVTLEPCPMCAGALVAARVARLVYGASDPRAGACGTLYNLCADPRLNHELAVVGGRPGRRLRRAPDVVLRRNGGPIARPDRRSVPRPRRAGPQRRWSRPRAVTGPRRATRGRVGYRTVLTSRFATQRGRRRAAASLRTRSERLGLRPEECESGRIGRSRKPLCLMGTVGSNPTSSARAAKARRMGECDRDNGRAGALPAAPGRPPAAGKE